MIIIVMGVTGSGKTTVGRLLAERLGWRFIDGDDLHPPENVRKMAGGAPLTDADRMPWLRTIQGLVRTAASEKVGAVIACSALKEAYREMLAGPGVEFLYLKATPELIRRRLASRRGHFMPAALIESQFAALEEPAGAAVVNASLDPQAIVDFACQRMELE